MCLTYATFVSWGVAPDEHILVLVFFATLFIYNLTRVLPLLLDKKSLLNQNDWFGENRSFTVVLTIFSGFVVCWEGWNLSWDCIFFLVHLGVISALYSLPMGWIGMKPLRDLPYLKIFLIAYVWGAVSVGLPGVSLGYEFFDSKVLRTVIEITFFIFAITVPFDIRDVRSDQNQSLKTLPHTVGLKNALLLATVILCVSSGISVYSRPEKWLPELLFFLVTVGLINYSSSERPNWYYLGLIDGTIILKSVVIWI